MHPEEIEKKVRELKANREGSSHKEHSHIPRPLEFLIDMAAGMVIGAFFGILLDETLHSSPFLLFICTISGTIGGFLNFYRRLGSAEK